MNMKKLTGVLVGAAVLVCGNASAAPNATTPVPLSFTIAGDIQSVSCTFEGNQARPNVTTHEILGTLTCTNHNSTSVTLGMVAGTGTADMTGAITLSEGTKKVSAELTGRRTGSRLPVIGPTDGPDTPAITNYTMTAGQSLAADLTLVNDETGLPAGEYKGSVVIGTWSK